MKTHSKFLLLVLSLVLFFGLIACGGDEEVKVEVSFDSENITLQINDERELDYTVSDENLTLEWSSSAPTIVEVDQAGKVRALKEGESTITVKVKDTEVSDTLVIKVEGPKVVNPTSLIVSADKEEVKVGETLQLTKAVLPAAASQEVVWSSSNEEIATVDANGLVTFVNVGMVNITATSKVVSSVKDLKTINVLAPDPTEVVVTTSNGLNTMLLFETLQMVATVNPELADATVLWTVDDTTIANISATGLLSAIAVGEVRVTATSTVDSEVKGVFDITISRPQATGLEATGVVDIIQVGEKFQITTKVTPNTAVQDVVYSSSNDAVATVSETGEVTGVGVGTVTINIVSVSNEELTKEFEIEVIAEIGELPHANYLIDASLVDTKKYTKITHNEAEYIVGINALANLDNVELSENSEIYILAGTYQTAQLNIDADNVKVYGPNKDVNPITGTRVDEAEIKVKILIGANVKNTVINGLTLNYDSVNSFVLGHEAGGIEGFNFSYNIINGASGSGAEAPIRFKQANADSGNRDFTFNYNHIRNIGSDRGIRMAYIENVTIVGNKFENLTTDAIRLNDNDGSATGRLVLQDNEFINIGQYGLFLGATTIQEIVITGNIFNGTGKVHGGGAMSLRTLTTHQDGTTISISKNSFTDTNTIDIRIDHTATADTNLTIVIDENEFHTPESTIYTNNLDGVSKTEFRLNNKVYDAEGQEVDLSTLFTGETPRIKNATLEVQ